MTQPTPIPEARGELMFDGQALLDRLNEAKLVSSFSQQRGSQSFGNKLAADHAFDVAEAFFSPLINALHEDIATLRREQERAFARANEAARLSAEARDHADDLRKQIANQGETIADLERQRLDRDAWAVRVCTEHNLYELPLDVEDEFGAIAAALVAAWRDLAAMREFGDKAVQVRQDALRERDSLLAAAKAVVDAGRCAGLGSVGAALVAAVEAVTHPGGET